MLIEIKSGVSTKEEKEMFKSMKPDANYTKNLNREQLRNTMT